MDAWRDGEAEGRAGSQPTAAPRGPREARTGDVAADSRPAGAAAPAAFCGRAARSGPGETATGYDLSPRSGGDLSALVRAGPRSGGSRAAFRPRCDRWRCDWRMPRAMSALLDDLAWSRGAVASGRSGRWRPARRSSSTARWSRPASCGSGCRPATRSSAPWAIRLSRPWRRTCAPRAAPPPSNCGGRISPARSSPSATPRPRCSTFSRSSPPEPPGRPLVLGFPVGFVGAAEAKEALIGFGRGLPYVTLRGRRGGSALAAAAVNALCSRRKAPA